jgi:DNA-binding CsgD family transcriptional regulator
LNLAIIHEHDPERLLAEVLLVLGEDLRLLGRPTSLLRPLVEAALATGRRAEAEEWTERVARDVERNGRLPAGTVRVACARAELALDEEPHRAAEIARAAVALGEAEAERAAEHDSRALRVRAREELSQRERSIAELVAEGRSNKEVAAALYVSPKTVENNLSRIYAKLGVRSRTELARALQR